MDCSLQLQFALELATYGYLLSSDWRNRAGGRSIQELVPLFQAMQKRWEAFEFTDKRQVNVNGAGLDFLNGMLGASADGASADDQLIRLLHFRHFSMKTWDNQHWIEHPLPLEDSARCWDESQDLLVLSSFTG